MSSTWTFDFNTMLLTDDLEVVWEMKEIDNSLWIRRVYNDHCTKDCWVRMHSTQLQDIYQNHLVDSILLKDNDEVS